VIARFEAERQALALMDHPNIAKVFDAGATESGRPYFVMELVRGVPITQYCDEHNLTVRERLELFIELCRAIQHAHQKGIIHRDVKPTNVLVSRRGDHDGRPVPKVIDFGVAKALSQQLTERTVYTQFAQMIGTPLYMSPEQAEMSGLDIDTRSDIYSLGVVLYELLTGTTPFDSARLKQAAVDEIRRIVREEEPPTPSKRLSALGSRPTPYAVAAKSSRQAPHAVAEGAGVADGTRSVPATLATIAAQCRSEPARLVKQVRGELDWIVMKCLEKDRNRRYESANGLATDVEHYLKDEPVQACPPSALYRFGKFARRNKVALLTALLVIASLLIGSAIATWQAVRATRAEQTAIANSEQAASDAATATAISDLLMEMIDSANPDAGRGAEFTVRQMLDQFADGLSDQLHNQPEAEATIRLTIGNAYRRLGLLDQAEPQIEAALAQRQDIFGHDHVQFADALVKKAWLLNEQADHVGAESLAREALAIYRKVGAPPQEIAALDVLSLAIWNQDADVDGRLAPVAQEIFDIAQRNPDGFPQLADLLHRLANRATARGDYLEAERLARRSVALHRKLQGNHHPETAWGLFELGRALGGQRKFEEAEASYDEALAIFRRYYRNSQKPILGVYSNLAEILSAQGDEKGLNELRAKALEIDAIDDPDWEWWRTRARLHKSLRQSEQATACFREAITLAPPSEAANLQLELGHTLSDQGKFDEAKMCYYNAVALFRRNNPDSNKPVLASYWNLGRTLWAQGDTDGLDELRATISEIAKLDDPDWESWSLQGAMLVNMGQWEEGAACFRKALELAEPRWAYDLQLWLAVALAGNGKYQEADEALRKALPAKPQEEAAALSWVAMRLAIVGERFEHCAARAVDLAEMAVQLAPGEKGYWSTLGLAHYRAHQWRSAIRTLTKAVDLSHGGDAQDWLFLAMAHWKHGNKEEARAWYDRAAAWMDKEGTYSPELRRYRRDAAELLGIAAPAVINGSTNHGEREHNSPLTKGGV
jgi:tetratricopeptide (TPR) repeat protein